MLDKLEPGSTFAGEYRVVRPIGRGGMGAVYEVEQLSTRKRRALKVLENRFGRDERARARFIREATIGASISSEHVVEVIDAGVDQATGLPWIAMELLDGADLKRLLDGRGPLGPAHTREVFRQLGHGLASAHAGGVVHRDLKPENVFVARAHRAGSSFTIKILDFGIAKITRESVMATDTATIGSPMWMAPEQVNAEPLSPRTDVWALGLLAFWTLTRRVYWKAAYGTRVTVQALFAEQLFASIDPPSTRARDYECGLPLPAEFDAWFSNCVARSPDARFADAGAAVNAFMSVLAELADTDPLRETPLLPTLGDSSDMRRSAPVPISSRPGVLSQPMAGTTADVIAGEATFGGLPENTTSPTSAAPGFEATNLHAGSDRHPTQFPPPPSSSASRASSTAPGRLAVAFAIPAAAIIGAGVMLAIMSSEDEDDDTPTELVRTAGPEVDAPPTDPKAPPADLSGLPTPNTVAFLGWTADGKRVAVRASYGNKLPADGRPANYVELVHVADGASGGIEASYVVDRVAASSLPADDPLARAAATAQTSERWLERRVSLLLQPPDARRAPRRTGDLRLELLDVPDKTRVQTHAKRGGFDVTWWGFYGARGAPRVQIVWSDSNDVSTTVLDERFGVDAEALARVASTRDATFQQAVRVFWSPDETRCVITFEGRVADDPSVNDRRWFLRAVAP